MASLDVSRCVFHEKCVRLVAADSKLLAVAKQLLSSRLQPVRPPVKNAASNETFFRYRQVSYSA